MMGSHDDLPRKIANTVRERSHHRRICGKILKIENVPNIVQTDKPGLQTRVPQVSGEHDTKGKGVQGVLGEFWGQASTIDMSIVDA